MNIPQEVIDLADKRLEARKNKDFAKSDQLREAISNQGFLIKDTASGYELLEKPEFEVFDKIEDIKFVSKNSDKKYKYLLLADGWLEDLKQCLEAILKYSSLDSSILILDLGNVKNVGNYLNELEKSETKIEVIHVSQTLEQAGWANSINKLVELNNSPFSVILDISTIISEDVISKMVEKITDQTAAVGWKGGLVNLDDQWRSVDDKGDGEVDIILGYFFVIKTEIAKTIPANPKAKFYRNADLEWSLNLRTNGYKLFALSKDLKIEQKRHHGYHDTEIEYREKESKKNYDRILQSFRGKTEILSPRR